MKNRVYKTFAYLQFGFLFIIIAGFIFVPKIYAQGEEDERTKKLANDAESIRKMTAKTTTTTLNKNTEDDLIETQISAYKAVACSANEINAKISDISRLKGITLMIYDEQLVATLSEYSILMNQLKYLYEKYEEEEEGEEDPPSTAGGAAALMDPSDKSLKDKVKGLLDPIGSVQNSVFDALARFKTDTDIVGTNAAIAKEEFIAKALKNLDIDVFYPDKAIPVFYDSSGLLEILKLLADKRVSAQVAMAGLEEDKNSEASARERYFRLKTLNEQYDRTLREFGIFSVTDSIENSMLEEKYTELEEDNPQKEFYEEQEGNPKWYKFNRERWRKKHGYPPQRNIVDYLRAEITYKLMKPDYVIKKEMEVARKKSLDKEKRELILEIREQFKIIESIPPPKSVVEKNAQRLKAGGVALGKRLEALLDPDGPPTRTRKELEKWTPEDLRNLSSKAKSLADYISSKKNETDPDSLVDSESPPRTETNSTNPGDEDVELIKLSTEFFDELFTKLKEPDDEDVKSTKPGDDVKLQKSDVYWFDVNIAAAGSNRRTQTNAVLDVFRGGNKQTFSSGAVVSYRIFSSNGRVLASDTVMTYMPYKKSGEITEYVCRPTNINDIP